MNKPLLSVIIPVYNAGDKINRCIESILNQPFKDFELILVDDGSTDDSLLRCNQFANQYENIRCFHKSNGGPSSARNLGLEKVNGEWVSFIDSDDCIGEDWYSHFFKYTNYDLIMQGFTFSDRGGEPHSYSYESHDYENKNIVRFILDFIDSPGLLLRGPYNKFFRKDIIKMANLRFDEQVLCGEDYLFNLGYIYNANSVKVLPVCSYMYERQASGLALRKYKVGDHIDWQLKIMKALVKNAERFGDEVVQRYFYKKYAIELTGYLLNISIEDSLYKVQFNKIRSSIIDFRKYIFYSKYVIAYFSPFLRRKCWSLYLHIREIKRKIFFNQRL